MPSAANLFGNILFGLVGLAAWGYGKKNQASQPMIFGMALMFFPWFVSNTWVLYSVGAALCFCLYRFRD